MPEPPLVPILVGVSGKRNLQGRDTAVRSAFRDIFDILDRRFERTPRILLSALATGADTIAVEEVLPRRDWSIVAPLPLSLDLYLEDFDAKDGARLQSLCRHECVRVLTLDPLIDPATNQPFPPAALQRRANSENPARTAHYEQSGLFVAERSALVIAVLPHGERPGKIGGTARIVQRCLTGTLDSHAIAIVRQSLVLCEPRLLDQPHVCPVWRIRALDEGAETVAHESFEPLLPPGDAAGGPSRSSVRASLRLPNRIHDFNLAASALADREPSRPQEQPAADAVSWIRSVRSVISAIQVRNNQRVRLSVVGIAALFVASVVMFELRAEFAPLEPAILPYAVLIGAALLIYAAARRFRWQPIAEDYRGVAEALRVQMVWWSSGLTGPDYRADRFYLHGAAGSLRLVRSAVQQIVNAALLEWGRCDADPSAAAGWISGQIKYFEERSAARRFRLSLVESLSWFLFMTALAPALYLTLAVTPWRAGGHRLLDGLMQRFSPSVVAASTAAGVGLLFVASAIVPSLVAAQRRGKPFSAFRTPHWLVGVLGGVLVVVALHALAVSTSGGTAAAAESVALKLVTLAVVFPAAFAGAIKFAAEKLSWEAEAHGYEDALATFTRAKADLESVEQDVSDEQRAERRRKILFALGKKALRENEAWIRAHRERPLEPLVGA